MKGPEEGRITARDGMDLHVRAWPASQPRGRILVVHGFAEHAGRYGELADRLTGAGWSVLGWDLRGHGRSGGRRGVLRAFGTLLEDLATVRAALDAWTPAPGPPVLLGHSLGGLVALRHVQAGAEPPRGLVLSAPWLATALPVPAWKRALAAVLDRVAPDLTLSNGLEPGQLTSDPVRAAAWREDPLVHDRISARLWREVLRAQERARADGPPADVPILILLPTGDAVADPAATEEWAARASAGALEVHRLEGGRHEPFHDVDRERALDAVVDWLAARGGAEEPRPDRRVSPPNLRGAASRPASEDPNVPRNATRDR